MVKKIVYGMVLVAVIALITVPWVLLTNQETDVIDRESEAVLDAFVQKYGDDKEVLAIYKPVEEYLVYWRQGDDVVVSLLADMMEGDEVQGVWLEIAILGTLKEQPEEE